MTWFKVVTCFLWVALMDSATQAERVAFNEQMQALEQERLCRLAIRQSDFPLSCYRWLHFTDKNPVAQQNELHRIIDRLCFAKLKSVASLKTFPQQWIQNAEVLSVPCRQQMQKKLEVLLYISEEGDPTGHYEFLRRAHNQRNP